MLANLLSNLVEVGINRKSNIIAGILDSDFEGIERALQEDPKCINDIHEPLQMNAAMLAAHGNWPEALESILEKGGEHLDFLHKDASGEDLMLIAMDSTREEIADLVAAAIEKHAPHLINNYSAYFADHQKFDDGLDESAPC